MKVGEIWSRISDDAEIEITNIFKEDDLEMSKDSDMSEDEFKDFISGMEDYIEYKYIDSGHLGVLERPDFVETFKRKY